MIIAQLSDPHVTVPKCDFDMLYHTAEKLKIAVERVNGMQPKPDLVFLTGDLVNGGSDQEYEVFKSVISALDMPCYLGVGNHDSRETFLTHFPEHTYLPSDGFIQYVIEQDGLRMIMLDTNIPMQPQGTLCLDRLDWLTKTLAEAPDTPTIIFMHHPPFKTGIVAMDDMGYLDPEAFGKIIQDQDQVLGIFCGHIHRSIQSTFYGKPTIVCPSTSHKILLHLKPDDRLATTSEPSEIMLHIWDKKGSIVTHSCFTDDYPVMWELDEM